MAKTAAERDPTMLQPATITHLLRRAGEATLESWTSEWRQRVGMGWFAWANRLPPRLKPRKHFVNTKREVYGRLLQCRTGHAFTGEYYARMVPTEATDCSCGHPYQTRQHILQDCEEFDEHRHILTDVDETLSMTELLGTEDGIAALAAFLNASSAFRKQRPT